MRCLLAANLTAILDQGQLTITDSDATGIDNSLVVTVVGADLVISDASEQFIAAPAGGTLSNGDKTLTIPLNLVTTTVTINGGGGNDTIEVNSLGGSFGIDLVINGNDGADAINFQTGPIVTSKNINVTVDTINVNTAVTAVGEINLISTGDDTLLAINAPISMGGTSRFIADKMAINASVDALLAHLTLAPESTADSFDFINIGSVVNTASNTLELSDAELDRITAGFIAIGGRSTGTFTISSSIEHAGDDSFLLETARNVIFSSTSGWSTHHGDLTINANNPTVPSQGFIGIDLNYATLKSSGTGDISLQAIAGSGGTSNTGISAHDGTRIESTGTGKIWVSAAGGAGTSDNRGVEFSGVGTVVTSTTGEILIHGRGGVGGDRNIGVWLRSGASVSSTGTATITIEGTGNRGANENNGVVFNAYGNSGATSVTTVDGNIKIMGHGPDIATGSGNRGIGMYEGSLIQSTGLGKISLDGTGGAGSDSARGVELAHEGTTITSATGDIQITGQGGDNTSGFGVWMVWGAAVESTGIAKITIGGTGGDAHDGDGVVLAGDGTETGVYSVNGNISIVGHGGNTVAGGYTRGVIVATGSVVQSTGVATIAINGTGGAGTDSSRGIEIANNGTRVTSAVGNIHITGVGGNNTAGHGVWIRNGGTVESTGTANIKIDGTGGNSEHDSRGIELGDANTLIQTVSGSIAITGHGGNGGYQNHGIYAYSGAVIQSTGTGNVTLTGTGGTGESSSRGIQLNDVGTAVKTVSGDIQIVGQGGDGSGSYSMGVWMVLGPTVSSLGTGSIHIEGTSGSGVDENAGVLLNGFGYGGATRVTSVDGDISIIGHASSETTGARNRGIGLFEGAVIESTGLAKISLDGHGSTGTDAAMGVELRHEGTRITSAMGEIHITGMGGDNVSGFGVWMLYGAAVESTGTAKITIDGTGGNAYDGNGIVLAGDGFATRISSVNGDITLTGQGGAATAAFTRGMIIKTGSVVRSTGAAKLTIDGTGGAAAHSARGIEIESTGTLITSKIGDIHITGHGGANTSGYGIWMLNSAAIESTGSAKVTIDGFGGNANDGRGITFEASARVSSVDGAIAITGKGGDIATGDAVHGLVIITGTIVESTGTASITLSGTGGDNTGGARGTEIADVGTYIRSVTGDINITGQGGTRNYGVGVWLRSGAVVESTGTAKINIKGTGGNGGDESIGVAVNGFGTTSPTRIASVNGDISVVGNGGNFATAWGNRGVGVYEESMIVSTGSARITLDGTGGTGTYGERGVELHNRTKISSQRGDISITGQGGAGSAVDQTYNVGVYINDFAVVESTATTGIGAKVTINGTAGVGSYADMGVFIREGSRVTSSLGDIQITGQGAVGTGFYNYGINVQTGSRVESTGIAKITLSGTGGTGAGYSMGVLIDQSARIQSLNGEMQITGQGGLGGEVNTGVAVQTGAFIESTGAGNISVHGTGGQGTTSHYGFRIAGADSFVRSVDGNVQIVGIGGTGSTTYNAGISIAQGSRVASTGVGDIDVYGTGGSGVYGGDFQAGQVGVWVLDGGSTISSKDGDITVTGIGGGGTIGSDANHGVKLQSGIIQTSGSGDVEVLGHAGNGAFSFGIDIAGDAESNTEATGIDTSAGSGNITLIANRFNIETSAHPGKIDAGTQTVTIHPKTLGFPVNIGGADDSTSLGLTNIELNQVTAAILVIGNDNTGTLSFSNDLVRQVPTDVQLISGGDILIDDGYVNTQTGALFLKPGPAPYAIKPLNTITDDVVANPVVLGGDLAIAINGSTVNSQYDQLSAFGIINLNGQKLVLIGSYVPLLGDTFTIVNNDANQAILGTFNGLPEGTAFLFNGRVLQITYLGGSGHDVVLTRLNSLPNANDATLSVTEDTATDGLLTVSDIDGPTMTYSVVTGASHGTVTITNAATGAYTYTPNAEYDGPDGFTFKVNDGVVESNIATVSITVNAVNDIPNLNLNGGEVTFSAKAARKGGPILVVPNVTVADPDQSPAFRVGGGTLTVSIDVSAKVTRKSVQLTDTIGGLSSASGLGATTGASYGNGKLVLNVALNANTTTADIQSFLRGITFKTKGPGLKQLQRNFRAQVTDAAGAASNILLQTITVTKQ